MVFQALRHRLRDRCRLVDEFRTSILCSNDTCINMNHPIRLKPNVSNVWSLKVCERCYRNWNRDINASFNGRDIVFYLQGNEKIENLIHFKSQFVCITLKCELKGRTKFLTWNSILQGHEPRRLNYN